MASISVSPSKSADMLEHLRLNSKKYVNVKESKNLIAIHENYIFVWHDYGSCILTSQVNTKEIKSDSFKILTLTNPPIFEVETLLFNQHATLLVLYGKNGVMVYEVPWRYGKFGSTAVSGENVLGRSWSIAEYFFMCSNRIAVVQAAWNPGSVSKTHLTVLSTDNYIRIYDAMDPQTPQQVIPLGAIQKSSYLSSESKISFSTCFGESAVGFDFGPPEAFQFPENIRSSRKEKSQIEEVIWPIFLLHENGNVFILKAPMKKEMYKSNARLEGPLAMFPPAEDNYGYDGCSILCLHTVPTSIILATATGMIYHCLVLENSETQSQIPYEFIPLECPSDVALYVFERVELPLTISDEQDDVYSHPLQLHKDITSHSRYHCTHISGVHSVAVPFLQALEECPEADELEKLVFEQQKPSCIVEHILCTKPLSQMDAVPVIGLDVTVGDAGVTIVTLLATWEFIFLPLITSYFPSAPQLLSQDLICIKDDKSANLSFEQHIEKTLQRSLCSPFLKSFSSADQIQTSSQQWLDLLCNVTQRFREDYIQRLSTAQALLRSRIKVLTQQKEYQLRDITRCQQEKESLKNGAERLAEKYEDAQANQQILLERIENVLKKLQCRLPYLSKAEIDMKQTLISYESKLKAFETSLDQIKKKMKNHKEKIKEFGDSNLQSPTTKNDLQSVSFSDTQMKHVKELLSQEGESIADLIKTVASLNKQVGV